MEYKISYRQVGREKGFLHPPRFVDNERQRQSIAERDAFGNRTQRFMELTNESPPPGAYYRPSTLERDARWCGSVSAKGYCGGFVSAVPRFRDVKMLQQAHLPGPGSYDAPTGVGSEGARLVSFSNLNRDRGLRPDLKANVPGPGEYNVNRKRRQRGRSGPTSSFLCQRRPLPVNTNDVTPAPGDYEVNRASKMKVDKKGIVLKDHFFRSGTKRDLTFISPNEGPGPGEYDVDRGLAVTKEPIVEREQSALGGAEDGNNRRTGRSREKEFATPGPGWYTPHQTKLHEKSSSSSSVFLSRTKRFARSSVTRAPGPAFYQPEPLEKKSFRWNAKRQWA